MLPTCEHNTDICVVGGGMAGLCAALAAARHGARVLLMHDRPVLGGNASSEIRMWICGAHGRDNRETGIMEELALENQFYNPDKNYSLWDSVLFGAARAQHGLETLYNCACQQADVCDQVIHSITGYQTTTQTFHRVQAKIFIDCSGDSVLAPLSGAKTRMGREGRDEYGEAIEPRQADARTMGLSCLMQARQEETPSTFTPPSWARPYTRDMLAPYRLPNMDSPLENFWYLELGGEQNSIADTESVRDELIAEALGIWDYIKNAPENKEKNARWRLDFLGFLPGKRESRRYIGDYVMTQRDVEAGGHFDDLIAYGGWSMDDHHPAGLRTHEPPTIFHPAPSPFGIPYRCLYAADIQNLMCAGRNISVSHAALSATRVMATCGTLGQAAGTAAAMAIRFAVTPREVGTAHMDELRAALMRDDCYLPFARREVYPLTREAVIDIDGQDASVLKDGIDRPLTGQDHGALVALNTPVTLTFPSPRDIGGLRVVFDSDLNRDTLPETSRGLTRPMPCNRPMNWPSSCVPRTLTRAFCIKARIHGEWRTVYQQDDNHQRLYTARFETRADALCLIPLATWGAEAAHLFAIDALRPSSDC